MKYNIKKLLIASAIAMAMTGCSSTYEVKSEKITNEAIIYSKIAAVWCGGNQEVKALFTEDDFVTITCMNGSNKTFVLED